MSVIIRFGCKRILLKTELLKNNTPATHSDSGFFSRVNYFMVRTQIIRCDIRRKVLIFLATVTTIPLQHLYIAIWSVVERGFKRSWSCQIHILYYHWYFFSLGYGNCEKSSSLIHILLIIDLLLTLSFL